MKKKQPKPLYGVNISFKRKDGSLDTRKGVVIKDSQTKEKKK